MMARDSLGTSLVYVGMLFIVPSVAVQHRSAILSQSGSLPAEFLSAEQTPLSDENFAQAEKIGSIEPIYYLHIPKCGSSISTTIAHYTCGDALPKNVSSAFAGDILDDPRYEKTCRKDMFARFAGARHEPLPPDAPLGQVVTMVRRPVERILSGYYAYPSALHQCKELEKKYHCSKEGWCDGDTADATGMPVRNVEVIPPLEYARCVENCTTNMLTDSKCSDAGPAKIEEAKSMIDKIGFIGITDHWSLSVCLFHSRFGGECLEVELLNTHKGTVSNAEEAAPTYDVSAHLGLWQPQADNQVYNHAMIRFRRELREHNVTAISCEERCGVSRNIFANFPTEAL